MLSGEMARPEEIPGFVTKVLLPRRRADVLARPRLIDFLRSHLDRRLLLVSAAAGYGKTTLLVDFVHQTGLPTCWLTLGPADADPQVFLEYLVAAVRRAFPACGARTLRYLRTSGPRDAEAAVGLLVSELHEATESYFLIVLDDLHTVDHAPAIQNLLNLLIAGLPSNCCCILASRSIPRVRLSRLVANRETAGLGTADLRFTPEEIRHLFSRHMQLLVPEAVIDELAREAEGWIAGIILTSHTLWQGLVKGIIRAKRGGGPLFDYLAREVFDHQDPTLRSFLLESSVLTHLSAHQCDALLDRSNSAELLAVLDEENLFVSRLDGDGDWYRYHALFREFLQDRLQRDDPARFAALHVRAAEHAAADGDVDAAIEHFRLGGDVERATDIVEDAAERVVESGRLETLLRWCAQLPPELTADRPRLQLARARAAFEASDLTQAEGALDLADMASARAGDRALIAATRVSRGVLFRLQGRYAEALGEGEAGLALAEELGATDLIALAYRQYGTTLGAAGYPARAIPALEQALAAYTELGDRHNQGAVCHALGVAWKRQGDLTRARVRLHEAANHGRTVGNGLTLAGTLVVLGNLHHEIGESREALRVLGEAQRVAREAGHLRLNAYATLTLAEVRRDLSDFSTAQTAYLESLNLAERSGERFLRIAALEGMARCHLYAGETTAALAIIQRARRIAAERDNGYERGICEDTYGLLCLASGSLEEAATVLEQACAWLAPTGSARELARARLHLAEACHRSGAGERASALAREALALLPAGTDDPLLAAEGRYVAPVLRAIAPESPRLDVALARVAPAAPGAAAPAILSLPRVATGPRSIRSFALGHADVEVEGRVLAPVDWHGQSARELWFYLVAHGPATSEQIAEALWPEARPARALNAFHQSVYRVRGALFADSIVRQGNLWRVSPDLTCWADDLEFERSADRPRSSGAGRNAEAREAADRALVLYRGPYLPKFDAQWCATRRHRLQDLFLHVLRDLIEQARTAGQHERVIGYAERFLQTEPDDEGVHEALMRSFAALGNRPAAIRHYQHYAQQLYDELRAQPPRRLRLLSEQIAQGG